MKVEWTEEQQSAIDNRDKTLLVSAAAGSGKTATLTERIICSLTEEKKDEKKPLSVDSLLVVTFTTTAAAELRNKISDALTKDVETNPKNDHLKKQLHLLPSAKIRTIDSFCYDILRANCDRVGIPPNFRIADKAECELLAISIIEGLIEAVYNGEIPEIATPDQFEELADCLTDSGKIKDLSTIFRDVHQKLVNAEEGVDLLGRMIEEYNCPETPLDDTLYVKVLMDRFHTMLDHYISCCQQYIRRLSPDDPGEKKCIDDAKIDLDILTKIRNAGNYEKTRELMIGLKFKDKTQVRNASAEAANYAAFRPVMTKDVTTEKEKFHYTVDEWRELYTNLYRLTSVFYRFEKEFDRQFLDEKRRHNALSFNDVLRYTYNCLIQDGRLTDIAKNVASQYDAIYIDEYQDVNALQNRIFEAISKPGNRFMVGDIKQSIYSFRSACPEIFATMKKTYPTLQEAEGDYASIFMSSNFRCDKGIIDFVNNIFDKAFNFVADSIGYVDSDRLKAAKRYKDDVIPEYTYPTVCIVDKALGKNGPAEVVASKIEELRRSGKLNDGSEIKYSDIAIILRVAKDNHSAKYVEALEKRGIPVCISSEKEFFLTSEVLLALCLLNTIDNPRRDIYLAGLLKSPLYNFSADELFAISRMRCGSLYESLVKYTDENPDFARGAEFLKTLDYYRSISEGIGVDTLIDKLYIETGLMSLASRNGGSANLTLLYDYARSFEAGSFKGLYNFIHFINAIIDKKNDFDNNRSVATTDAVTLITAHLSKGLEYPIVFCVETDTQIDNKDNKNRYAYSENFGFSFLLRTPSGIALAENPVQKIIQDRVFEKIYEEELRILYVMLTRAREKLYVVGRSSLKDKENFDKRISLYKDNLSAYSFRKIRQFQDIILTCDSKPCVDYDEFCDYKPTDNDDNDGGDNGDGSDGGNKEGGKVRDEALYNKLKERFSYEYPNALMTVLPEKMSVSLMSPTILDAEDSDEADDINLLDHEVVIEPEETKRRILPAFASGDNSDESAKRGIATHLFMQFCDLDNLAGAGADAELDRLKKQGFISEEDAIRVRIREIELFRKSNLIKEMMKAKKIHRELRFNVYLSASNFTADEEKRRAYADKDILVQGVIDCIVERDDGSILLCDYKTDRLTREELCDRSLAEKKLRDKHSMQLGLYSLAIEKIFGKKPESIQIYSLPLGDTVDIV